MTFSLGIFGCGVMGQRHIKGMGKLHAAGLMNFQLAGVCDLIPDSANRAADLAQELLGHRPQVFTSFAEMKSAIDLNGISITTAPAIRRTWRTAAQMEILAIMRVARRDRRSST